MAKTYAGVLTDIPIYETVTAQVPLTLENIGLFFDYVPDTVRLVQTSNPNSNVEKAIFCHGVKSTYTTIVFTAKEKLSNIVLYVYCRSSTPLILRYNGETQSYSYTGDEYQLIPFDLEKGGTLSVEMQGGFDEAHSGHVGITCDPIETTREEIVGYEQREAARQIQKLYCSPQGTARRVKRGYVGDENGIARRFFEADG